MPRPSKFALTKKDMHQFPFHMLTEAYLVGQKQIEQEHKEAWDAFILEKEAEYVGANEAPYEGNFNDLYTQSELTLSQRNRAGFAEVELVLESLGAGTMYTWLMPQVLMYLHQTVKLVKDDDGLYNGTKTLKAWVSEDPVRRRGIIYYLTIPKRGVVVKSQSSPEGRDYSALVPLFLSAFKKYRDVPYSAWNPSSLDYVVAENLLQAMLIEEVPQLSVDELLEIRTLGLTTAGGKTAGTMKVARSTFKLTGIQDTLLGPLNAYSNLAVTMLCQTWVADPSIRCNLMILDPIDWDATPPPLVSIDLFTKPAPVTFNQPQQAQESPWL